MPKCYMLTACILTHNCNGIIMVPFEKQRMRRYILFLPVKIKNICFMLSMQKLEIYSKTFME